MVTQGEIRGRVKDVFKHYSWIDWECACEVCLDRQKDGIDEILALIKPSKLLNGNRIDEILHTTFASHEEGANKSPIKHTDILKLLEEQLSGAGYVVTNPHLTRKQVLGAL